MWIFIGQIIVSIVLIILVLLQERSSGISGIFGGGGGGETFYQTKRGLEKIIFISTIVLIVLFAGLSLLNLIL